MQRKSSTIGHVRLISLYWCRYVIRSGSGLVYLLIALVFGLTVAHVMIMPVEQLMIKQKREMGQVDPEAIDNTIVAVGRPIIDWALGNKSAGEMMAQGPGMLAAGQGEPSVWSQFLLQDKPALLSAILLILLFGMPFVISFLAFNQISGDVQSRGLRYLLLRTSRSSIYFGRFLGAALFSTLVMGFLIATVALYLGLKIRIYSAPALVVWSAQGFLALAVLMLPYIAVCSLISASADSPLLSLVLAKLVIAGILIMAVLSARFWEPARYLKFVLPWGCQNHLLHPDATHWLGAGLACFVYTGIFLGLGYLRFTRRDL